MKMTLRRRITTAATGTVVAALLVMGFINTVSPRAPSSAGVAATGQVCSARSTASGLKQKLPLNVHTGSDASAFVENLLKTNPRFAKAQQMAEREFGGNPIAYTVHEVGAPLQPSSRWQRLAQWLAPALAAQAYGADDGSGYVVFSTYYDDYSSYWEGNTYAQSYDGGVWETIDSGIYTPSNSIEWTGSSAGTAETPPQVRSRDRLTDVLAFFFPALHAASPCDCPVMQWSRCALRNALEESWSMCAGSAGACLMRVYVYWECVGVACSSRFAGSFLNQLWQIRNGCA